jgi:hypothetical protein
MTTEAEVAIPVICRLCRRQRLAGGLRLPETTPAAAGAAPTRLGSGQLAAFLEITADNLAHIIRPTSRSGSIYTSPP